MNRDEAMRMAANIRDDRDLASLPVLADALEEAGYRWPKLLVHFRDAANIHKHPGSTEQCIYLNKLLELGFDADVYDFSYAVGVNVAIPTEYGG